VFGSSSGPQLNDFNPGINPYPAGLFWTIPLHPQSVRRKPGAGRAIYKAEDVQIEDYGDLNAAFSGRGRHTGDRVVRGQVVWRRQASQSHDEDAGFAAEFVRGKAQMQWSAVVGDYRFTSDPLSTSSSDFAEIGTMRNGTFFPHR
jgi:hypothetical protein